MVSEQRATLEKKTLTLSPEFQVVPGKERTALLQSTIPCVFYNYIIPVAVAYDLTLHSTTATKTDKKYALWSAQP